MPLSKCDFDEVGVGELQLYKVWKNLDSVKSMCTHMYVDTIHVSLTENWNFLWNAACWVLQLQSNLGQ